MNKIVLASNNKNKLLEFEQLFKPMGIEVISMKAAGVNIDIIEDGETFEENAHIKAKTVFDITKLPTIADDSGLEIDFLNGAPGIYSARYAGEDATDLDKNNKVLAEMSDVDMPLRTARFVCAIYFIISGEEEYSITGTVDGFISKEAMGNNGFGYDPIFLVEEGKSMAMLSEEEKNEISHRAMAFKQLKEIINSRKGLQTHDK
ncbi:MAG: XTP/dITP diphosphatase [Clostridiales bacterium]|nr:XTP/dITP diphosphatase [Clostridiales bacterium]